VCCLEISVACKLHHIVFPHAFFEPVADRRSPEIVEGTFLDACSMQDPAEIWAEIVDHLQPRIRIGPLALGTKLVLYVIVSGRRHKDIRMSLGLSSLVINQKLHKFIGHAISTKATFGILDSGSVKRKEGCHGPSLQAPQAILDLLLCQRQEDSEIPRHGQ